MFYTLSSRRPQQGLAAEGQDVMWPRQEVTRWWLPHQIPFPPKAIPTQLGSPAARRGAGRHGVKAIELGFPLRRHGSGSVGVLNKGRSSSSSGHPRKGFPGSGFPSGRGAVARIDLGPAFPGSARSVATTGPEDGGTALSHERVLREQVGAAPRGSSWSVLYGKLGLLIGGPAGRRRNDGLYDGAPRLASGTFSRQVPQGQRAWARHRALGRWCSRLPHNTHL